jgi:uncharacterized protein YjeT (DUF2065 family)
MDGPWWLAAFGLMLVLEGLLPLAVPATWKALFRQITSLRDGQVRFFGAASVAAGLLLLAFVT